MGTTAKRAFRPTAERFEERALTTGGLSAALSQHFTREAAGQIQVAATRTHGRPWAPPLPSMTIGPGLGEGLVRLALPLTYQKFGVVSIWNNTTNPVYFGVSASTYANGQYFAFTVNPGSVRSFFAPYAGRFAPVFRLNLNPNFQPVTLPQINIVYDDPAYVPVGTAGRPYAINLGPNGPRLSFI